MEETEISYNEELGAFELCSTCLSIAMDAAYPSGYPSDSAGEVPVLEVDFDEEECSFSFLIGEKEYE